MSSRSFRRRSNRRKRRPQDAGEKTGTPPEPRPNEPRPNEPRPNEPRPNEPLLNEPRPNEPRRPGGASAPRAQREGSSRRENRGAGGRSPEARAPRPELAQDLPECPVCRKKLRELPTALTHKASGKPAHFDCIVKELRDSTELASQEKLCYLGGGAFGILEFRQAGGQGRFVIKKRIQYEEKETPQEWKKTLLVSC